MQHSMDEYSGVLIVLIILILLVAPIFGVLAFFRTSAMHVIELACASLRALR